ncbi:MAG TPA: hypothetical protein VK759_03130, partial [Rhizomicrobium sp.]|nr:hypothetical protein [Rhizomicrobium sp.]
MSINASRPQSVPLAVEKSLTCHKCYLNLKICCEFATVNLDSGHNLSARYRPIARTPLGTPVQVQKKGNPMKLYSALFASACVLAMAAPASAQFA